MTKAQALLMLLSLPVSTSISAQRSAGDAPGGPLDSATIEADIEAALINRVDEARITVGIVASVLTLDGRRYFTRGVSDRESGAPITPDTISRSAS